jgi:hypothetical protein
MQTRIVTGRVAVQPQPFCLVLSSYVANFCQG